MMHVFLLMVFLGEGKQPISNDMYFYSIDRCNYFASRVVTRYGNYKDMDLIPLEHRATAYCKPVYTNPSARGIKVYD